MSKLFNVNLFIKNDYKSKKTIILHNHVSIYDIFISFICQAYYNNVYEFCLKKQVSYIPGIGWWCRIMNFPILSRSKLDIETLKNHKTNNSVLIYPEGTRLNKKKYKEAAIFAKKNNIKHSKYTLIPKSTGSFNLVQMKDIEYVTVSLIIYFDNNGKILNNFKKILFPKKVMIYNKNYPINQIPKKDTEFKKWLHNEFYKVNDIKNIDLPENKIQVKPRFSQKILVLITLIYPIILFYLILF